MPRWRFLILVIAVLPQLTAANDTPIIGWIEQVRIMPEGFKLDAKIDTGADHSSLDAYQIKYYTRAGQQWVKFKVYNNHGKSFELDKMIHRITEIKHKQGGTIERPVIMLDICLGKRQYSAPVNLAKREHFKYRMLIGRSFLENRYLVDAGRIKSVSSECKDKLYGP